MRSYMNLTVLALAASTVLPALSAPTRYRVPRADSDVFRHVELPRFRRSTAIPDPSEPPAYSQAEPAHTYPPVLPPSYPLADHEAFPDLDPNEPLPPYSAPADSAPPESAAPKKWKAYAFGGGGLIAIGIISGVAAGLSKHHNPNITHRTFEAFEGRADDELVERALGDHDLDKRLALSTLANFPFGALGTRAESAATRTLAGVSKDDLSHNQEMSAALSALGHRDVTDVPPGDTLQLFSRMLDEFD